MMIYFYTHLHGFLERRCSNRENHKFLLQKNFKIAIERGQQFSYQNFSLIILSKLEKKKTYLHGQFIASMRTSIDDIKCRYRKNQGFVSSKIGYVLKSKE